MAVFTLHRKAPQTVPLRKRIKTASVKVTFVEGRNTEEMLRKSLRCPKGQEPDDFIEALLASPPMRRHLESGLITTDIPRGEWDAPREAAEVVLPVPSSPGAVANTPPPEQPPEGRDEPKPWAPNDRKEQLAEALQSRGIDPDGMTKDEILTALKAWDSEGAGGES